MTENRQEFDVDHASRLLLRFDRARVAVRWEPVERLIVEHAADLPVHVDVTGGVITVVAERESDESDDWGQSFTWWSRQWHSHDQTAGRHSRVKVDGGGVHVDLGPLGRVSVTDHGVDMKVDARVEAIRRLVEWLYSGWRGDTEAIGLVLHVPLSIQHVEARGRRGTLVLANLNGEAALHLRAGDLLVSGGHGHITATLGSGDAQFVDIQGDIEAQVGSGDVALSAIHGAISLKSGSGDVTVEGGSGKTELIIGSGDLRYIGRDAPSLVVQNGSGDVDLRSGHVQKTSLQLGSGDIVSQLWLGLGRHEFFTGTGDIDIAIPQDLAARIEVVTRGDVDSAIPLVTVGQRGPRSLFGRRMVGSIGTGEPRAEIVVHIGQGDVSLRWLVPSAPSPQPVIPSEPLETPEPVAPTSMTDQQPVASPSAEPEATETLSAEEGSVDLNSERAVLEALARGEISVAEAEELLDILSRRSERPA